MRIDLLKGTILAFLLLLTHIAIADESEISLLRAAIEELRSDYDARIAELELRLSSAEQNVVQANAEYLAARDASSTSAAGNSAFNPAIGVIFQGQAWSNSENPDDYIVPGFPFGGEAGPISEGLGIGETELVMNANVDDKFSALLTVALALEDGEAVVEIEEAWVEATSLPAGLGARVGRFFSGIGYLNEKHSHAWEFADQPLPYQAFLANQYIDDGVQLRWIAPTDVYLEFGGELFQGSRYPAVGSANAGFGTYSLFANIGGDINANNSWLAGVSYLDAEPIERPSGDAADPFLFSGASDITSAHFVWKWSPHGNWKDRNFVLQSEYFRRSEAGEYSGAGLSPSAYNVDQTGWYLQAVFQPVPRWRVGGRIDGLSSDNPGPLFAGTALALQGSDPRRFSVMADWSNSEFSRIRLQFTNDDAGLVDGTEWGVQYIHSIGAHGAHAF